MRFIEQLLRWAGGFALLVTLGAIFYGLGRGLRRPFGQASGRVPRPLTGKVSLISAGPPRNPAS